MGAQTTLTNKVYFPDGARVSIKANGEGSYTDIGAIDGDISLVFNYDKPEYVSANAGPIELPIKNQTVATEFNLIQIDPDNIHRLGGGVFTKETQNGTPVATIDNQVIASGDAVDLTPYNLSLIETGASALKAASEPTITSVTGSTDGALVADDDYIIIPDGNSPSGFSIVFNLTGTALTTMAQSFTIVYSSVTPLSYTELYAGSTSSTINPYAIKFTHYSDVDTLTVDRELELYAATTNSGGLAFTFGSADNDTVEMIPVAITGKISTALDDGKQLFRYYQSA